MNKLIVTLIRQEKIDDLIAALKEARVAFTYITVKGFCGEVNLYRANLHDRVKVEILAEDADVEKIKEIIMNNACCGLEGDGCFFVQPIDGYMLFS